MSTTPVLYLVDGTAYIHRGYHAIRNLSNSRGLPTNAIFSFTNMLLKFLKEEAPRYAVVTFDARGPNFRHEISPDYKANRPPMPEDMAQQIPYIKKIVAALHLPLLEQDGYEADDLIGTLARQSVEKGFEVVIVSGDKDFQQLVNDAVTIWDPLKEKTLDRAQIVEKFGIQPEQMLDVMALAGDTADNIKGVPGIGEKTALSLIQTFGSLEALYQEVDGLTKKKQRENLIAYQDQAYLSRRLAAIETEVPLDDQPPESLLVGEPDRDALHELFRDLEFSALQKAFPPTHRQTDKQYKSIHTAAELADLRDRLLTAEAFAFDTETTSLDPMVAELVGLAICLQAEEAYYIPCGHVGPDTPAQLSAADIVAGLQPAFQSDRIIKVAQNLKYDWTVLKRYGLDLARPWFDTMVAAYLLNPSRRSYGLDQLALDWLGHQMISYREVTQNGKSQLLFSQVPLETAVPYACEDADITFSIYQLLSAELAKAGLKDLFETIEMPLIPVLMEMEMQGVVVQPAVLRALSQSFAEQLAELETRIYGLAGESFNINSPQQLGHILFEKLGLPTQKKTKKKTGYSTDMEVLSELAKHHELPDLIIKNRTLAKLKSTYTDALLTLINPDTGRVHTSFNQTATATGRLSSTDPNLQNIPIRDAEGRQIRQAFTPRDGWTFLAADYSQIELRLLAHYSEDDKLLESFENNEDIHTRTASEVFQIFPELITPEVRRQAKAINFGIIYGMSPYGLARELDITQKMAKNYIDGYFARYSGVKAFMEQTLETARQTGQTQTLLGRLRHLPDINSSNANTRKFAERIAINTPIQGTAADIIKLAMINLDGALKRENFSAVMLLSVHDEIVLECPPAEIEPVFRLVETIMEGVLTLKVALKVEIGQGKNWAEAH